MWFQWDLWWIETINKEFKAAVAQANGPISEPKRATISIALHKTSKRDRSKLFCNKVLAQENARRTKNEVRQKQEMIMNALQKSEEKQKTNRAQLDL